jgi:hypothetical protein
VVRRDSPPGARSCALGGATRRRGPGGPASAGPPGREARGYRTGLPVPSADVCCTPGGIRTRNTTILSRRPLPVGLPGRAIDVLAGRRITTGPPRLDPAASAPVPGAPGLGQGVTVRTQDPEVLQAVVRPVAVDVVELERRRLPLPLLQPTTLTSARLQAGFDQPFPKGRGIRPVAVDDEDLLEGAARDPSPRPTVELEVLVGERFGYRSVAGLGDRESDRNAGRPPEKGASRSAHGDPPHGGRSERRPSSHAVDAPAGGMSSGPSRVRGRGFDDGRAATASPRRGGRAAGTCRRATEPTPPREQGPRRSSVGPGAIAAGADLQGPPTSGRVTKETEAQLLHPRPDREVRRTSVPETQPTDDLRDR